MYSGVSTLIQCDFDILWVFVQFTARLLKNSSVRVKISCWCPPCYCWNAELCFIVFVVKFIVYVYACRGLGPKAVNKISIYLSIYIRRTPYHAQLKDDKERSLSGVLMKQQTILINPSNHQNIYWVFRNVEHFGLRRHMILPWTFIRCDENFLRGYWRINFKSVCFIMDYLTTKSVTYLS